MMLQEIRGITKNYSVKGLSCKTSSIRWFSCEKKQFENFIVLETFSEEEAR